MNLSAQLEEATKTKAEVLIRGKTADGKNVAFWSDASVTSGMGYQLPGVPLPRRATREALAAGWLFMGEVSLWDLDELHALYKAAKWAAKRGGRPGDVRARASKLLDPKPLKLKPVWTVTSADQKGRPTERTWRLPRIMWPGLAVYDHVNMGSTRGGRYEVFNCDRHNVCTSTGVAFKNLAGLTKYLMSVRANRG